MKNIRKHIPAILCCWTALALAVPGTALSVTESMPLGARIANALLPTGIVWLLLASSRKIGRTVWLLFPFVFFAAFQIVLLGLYGYGVIGVDMFLNVVSTNTSEAEELLGSLGPSLIFVGLLFLPPLIAAAYVWRRHLLLPEKFLKTSRIVSGSVALTGTIALTVALLSGSGISFRRDIYPLNAAYNMYLAFDRTVRTSRYAETSRDFSYDAESTRPTGQKELCILVVGETSRASEWNILGYGRQTNPRLSKRDGIVTFPRAYSESNATHKAVPLLLSPADATDFDSTVYRVKSLVTAFREAGFKTAFISNQAPNHSFIEFFASEADTTIYIPHNGGSAPPDTEMLPVAHGLIECAACRQLVVLHCYGSHFNYRDRYGEEDALFLPDDFQTASAENRPHLVNAYDNTIVATDRFLDNLIGYAHDAHCPVSLLYASDHGEDIFDRNSTDFLHASPRPTLEQTHVAMFAWLSDEYRLLYPDKARNLEENSKRLVSSSRSFCPTALSLAGIDSPKVDAKASLADAGYTPRRQIYLDDHNQWVYLNSIIR